MANTTAFGAVEAGICELFADYLEGDVARPALALSSEALPAEARNAIEKSVESFGYACPTCTFATLAPADSSVEGSDIKLDAQALFMLVEGLDPLFVVVADCGAVEALAKALRSELPLDAPARAFGRPAAAFSDLAAELQSEAGKQRAWKILKSLNA